MMPNTTNTAQKPLSATKIGFIILLIFLAELFVYTWSRVQCVGIGYEISQAADEHQELVELQNKLNIELATLKSLDRIGRIAHREFQLTMPKPEQIIVIQ